MRQIGALRSCVKERFAVPASCLGVGFISTWTELNYINSPVVYAANHDALFALFDAGTIVLAIVMAVVVRFVGVGRTIVSSNRRLALTCFCLMASTCVNYGSMLLGLQNSLLLSASAIVGGAGVALLFVMWFEVLSHLNPVNFLFVYAVAAICRVATIWLCGGMSLDRLWVSLCLVAILATLTLAMARDALAYDVAAIAPKGENDASAPAESLCSFPRKPFMVVLTGTFALSFILRAIGNDLGTNGNPGVVVAALCVLAVLLKVGDAFEFKWLWRSSLALMLAAVAAFLAYGRPGPLVPGVLACVSYELCLMLMYSILGNLVYRNFCNSTFLFSAELAVALTAGHCGDSLARWVISSFTSETVLALVIASGLLAALFCIACIRAFAEKNLDDSWGSIVKTPISKDMGLLLEKSRLGLRCHELAEEAGLSKREEEVLLLLAYKKKPSEIAKQLVIEVSTVNTHKKHVYQKLDVHSAKQLQERIGTVE